MNTLLKSLASLFTVSQPLKMAIEDPTVYQVETSQRKYCGKILYQNDVMIKLKGFKPKPVKILKANIERIVMVENESARQYYQWHSRLRVQIN